MLIPSLLVAVTCSPTHAFDGRLAGPGASTQEFAALAASVSQAKAFRPSASFQLAQAAGANAGFDTIFSPADVGSRGTIGSAPNAPIAVAGTYQVTSRSANEVSFSISGTLAGAPIQGAQLRLTRGAGGAVTLGLVLNGSASQYAGTFSYNGTTGSISTGGSVVATFTRVRGGFDLNFGGAIYSLRKTA